MDSLEKWKMQLQLQNEAGHRMGGWESDRSQAGVTLAQMRFTEKARGNGLILKQWAGEGRNAGDPGYPYEVLSKSLQIQQQELNVIPF